MIEQNRWITHWTPDEVAECVGGLGDCISRRLWRLSHDRPFTEEPVVEEQTWWGKLTEEDQQHINSCCEKEFGPFNS